LTEADQKDVETPPKTGGLETWQIALIILGVLAVLGGVAAVFFFLRRGQKPAS
jgi:flagellar basal body-associated protein FliL